MLRRALIRLATIVALLAAWPAGAAGAAANWTPVTGSLGSSIYQAGEVRSADGTLHVTYEQNVPGSGGELRHVAISPGGVVSSTSTITTGWAALGNPAIVSTPSGLEVYFGGIQCSSGTCPQGMFASRSTDGGATWSAFTPVVNADQVYASDINAVTLSDGTPFQTWWHTTGTTVHRSDSATSPDYDFQGAMGAGCCGYYSNLAADGAGHLQLAWDSNASGFIGTWSRAVDPTTGAPSGTAMLMPGSATRYSGSLSQSQMTSRTPIIALPGAVSRFFVAYPAGYPTTTRVLLWQVGQSTSTTVVSESGDHNHVSLAADAKGRIWVFWTHTPAGSGPQVFARRLDAGGGEPVIDLGAPGSANAIYAIDGAVDPNGDPEVLALAGLPNGSYGTFYARGPQVAAVPAPVLGKSFSAAVVSGTVLVKLPAGAHATEALAKGRGFEALTGARSLPAGTSVDARAGSIALVTATGKRGTTQRGVFGGGLFRLSQARTGLNKGETTLSLLEGDFAGAPSYAQCRAKAASDPGRVGPLGASAAGNPKKVLQTLHASDRRGRFRTRTRASAATVRGTVWDTIDRCGGTITRVRRGTVDVFNLHTRKTFIVHAGHSYYARLP